jgi:uracil-DNA glycosylase
MEKDINPGIIPGDLTIDLIGEVAHYLEYMSDIGCSGFDCSDHCLDTLNTWSQQSPGGRETLSNIREDLGDCRRCGLSKYRKQIVFGEGDPDARLIFVGEGPGFEEDKQGRPFVGPAGQLLTKIIAAINMTRESVYICNIVKCRPPENRNPSSDEAENCKPFLIRQIKAIKPDFICALGSVAARTLLDTTKSVSMLRNRFFDYKSTRLLVTYHPAYLLRNPEKKRDVWEDMKMLMNAMES